MIFINSSSTKKMGQVNVTADIDTYINHEAYIIQHLQSMPMKLHLFCSMFQRQEARYRSRSTLLISINKMSSLFFVWVVCISVTGFLIGRTDSKSSCHGASGPICTPSNGSPAESQLVCWADAHAEQCPPTATNQEGIPMPSLTASQAIGTRGQVLLQDAFLLEKLAAFNRERIPERVVHAKGAGAFGTFEVTQSLKKYTKANFLDTVGKKTEIAARFSTVAGEAGSADTWTDFKGFAIKFYTEEGNHDLVGNNVGVFSLRDAMLFPDFARSEKRNPATHLRDATSWWDFVSRRPETTTVYTLILFSDTGTPTGYRRMDGAGVHTFKLVNEEGTAVYVKFNWYHNQDDLVMTPQEAIRLAGVNPDVFTQDLYDAIATGDYPSWDLFVQIMTLDQAATYREDPFDSTIYWREKEYPLIGPIGRLTLNRNPTDYFTEIESLAFSPANMVPGIEPSPDRVLHARMFAYADAQRYRLGPNYAQLEVNRAKSDTIGYFRDGPMCAGRNGGGSPNYYPNSYGGVKEGQDTAQHAFPVAGVVDRIGTEDAEYDYFGFVRDYVSTYLDEEQLNRMVNNMAASLVKADPAVQERFLENNCKPISEGFRAKVARALDEARLAMK